MWMWTTTRKLKSEPKTEVDPRIKGHPLAAILMMGETHNVVTGVIDFPALFNPDTGVMAREWDWQGEAPEEERKAHEGEPNVVGLRVECNGDTTYLLDETLDSFAAKVGAPPRIDQKTSRAMEDIRKIITGGEPLP